MRFIRNYLIPRNSRSAINSTEKHSLFSFANLKTSFKHVALDKPCLRVRRFLEQYSSDPVGDEVFLKPRLVWARSVIYTLLGSIAIATVYAFSASIDEVAVVTGELKPLGNTSTVKSLATGKVTSINRHDGDYVAEGDVVLLLDPTISRARVHSLKLQLSTIKDSLRDQSQIFQYRKQQLQSQLRALKFNLQTQKNILNRYRPLVEVGAIQELQYLEQLNRLQSTQAEYEQVNSRLGEIESDFLRQNKESLSSLSDLNRQLIESEQFARYESIRSPASGHIFDLKPKRPGYVVSAGESLFSVVPDQKLEANLIVTNQYIGFIREGMKADIRVDAYPYSEYGSILGKVTSVSSDALPPDEKIPVPRFSVTASLDSQTLEKKGKTYTLQSGQTVAANIILRKRRVATLLTDIVDRSLDSLRSIRGR